MREKKVEHVSSCQSGSGDLRRRLMKSDDTLKCSGKSERKRQEERKCLPPAVFSVRVVTIRSSETEEGKGREEMCKET